MNNRPTQTTNRFHFSDLDPLRFEDIAYELLYVNYQWLELTHLGRSGSDGGIDIRGTQIIDGKSELWLIQCKRYQKLSKNDLTVMVDKLLQSGEHPDKIVLIISCDISAAKYNAVNNYCSELGIPQLIIWTATMLESLLYAHPRIKAKAFGEDFEKEETKKNADRIKRGLKMEKRILKELINHKFIKNRANWDTIMKNPSTRFISDEFYIRDVNDKTYPNLVEKEKGKISPWFRSFIYDTYHQGLEFWLSPSIGTDIIMNKEGLWEAIWNSNDPRLKDPQYKVIPVKAIGRIPYHGIVDFSADGDNLNPCPHLYCLFDQEDGMPYEEIYYRYYGGEKNGFIDWEVERSKRTEFPK
ncbi:restriction endonuclease [Mucilaginibacter litoreus]|uniref:Restriction endonuclease n=1 Tax=Mucilaginibacter litoreus TaxID=1048221 RepID=A0ABW3AM30_9SPHI